MNGAMRISEEIAETTCDGCGISEGIGAMGRLIPVIIAINEGEEGGHVTELDYCDDCIVERAPAFVAAGAKAPIVTGEDLPFDEEDA
jgi:hypothetical protein